MDDTKKLIEKYKRELMELSAKQKKTPKIIGYVDGDNNFLSGLQADIIEGSASGGLAKTKGTLGEANSPVPTDPRDEPDVIFERAASDNSPKAAGEPGTVSEISDYGNASESGSEPDVIFEPPDSGNLSGSGSEPAEVSESPDFVDTEYTDGGMTEIIDEYAPEIPSKSREVSEEQAPKYTQIPSAAQVRADITKNSEPQNNVVQSDVSGITDNSPTTPRADVADTIRTTEEQAERLNDQPVSGTAPDEQLTGRSFEAAELPPDADVSMEQGSRAEPINYPESNFTNFEEFEKVNTGRGTLIFRVYTGREAVVIEGAECVISKKIGGETRTIARLITNESGQTSVQELPAPPKELSQHSENTIQPFALYDAEVTKPGFVRVVLKDIPVFDGVQSVQRVFMIIE